MSEDECRSGGTGYHTAMCVREKAAEWTFSTVVREQEDNLQRHLTHSYTSTSKAPNASATILGPRLPV